MKNKIPDRWEDYSNLGERIKGTRFICFKVPLDEKFSCRLSTESLIFTPEMLVKQIKDKELELGLVVDLTNTDRYYTPQALIELGVAHEKIKTMGHAIPGKAVRKRFYGAVDKFLDGNMTEGSLVGVHCTHGLNRTGHLVCRYMIDRIGMNAEDAITAFNEARGHNIERENYLEDLRTGKSHEDPDYVEPPVETEYGHQKGRERRDNRRDYQRDNQRDNHYDREHKGENDRSTHSPRWRHRSGSPKSQRGDEENWRSRDRRTDSYSRKYDRDNRSNGYSDYRDRGSNRDRQDSYHRNGRDYKSDRDYHSRGGRDRFRDNGRGFGDRGGRPYNSWSHQGGPPPNYGNWGNYGPYAQGPGGYYGNSYPQGYGGNNYGPNGSYPYNQGWNMGGPGAPPNQYQAYGPNYNSGGAGYQYSWYNYQNAGYTNGSASYDQGNASSNSPVVATNSQSTEYASYPGLTQVESGSDAYASHLAVQDSASTQNAVQQS